MTKMTPTMTTIMTTMTTNLRKISSCKLDNLLPFKEIASTLLPKLPVDYHDERDDDGDDANDADGDDENNDDVGADDANDDDDDADADGEYQKQFCQPE